MDNEKSKKTPIFAMIILAIIITLLIAVSFFYSENKCEITSSIIILVCLLTVVFLSNSFDNFHIGKIITLERNINEYKDKNEKLEKRNAEIISQLINLNLQSQHTTNMNFNGVPQELKDIIPGVQQASEEEKEEKKQIEEKEEKKQIEEKEEKKEKEPIRRLNTRKLEELILKKCIEPSKYATLVKDIKVNDRFDNIDPISTKLVIFDAYCNDSGNERFIEILKSPIINIHYDRIYVMLNKIYYYRKLKNPNANLTLLIAKIPGREERYSNPIDRFQQIFLPAISSGLLNILEVEMSKEEMESVTEKM